MFGSASPHGRAAFWTAVFVLTAWGCLFLPVKLFHSTGIVSIWISSIAMHFLIPGGVITMMIFHPSGDSSLGTFFYGFSMAAFSWPFYFGIASAIIRLRHNRARNLDV
jgi:hypothetical protein